MTKEVVIGGQTVKIRATGNLPMSYRLLFNRDLLRDMNAYRKKLQDALENKKEDKEPDTDNILTAVDLDFMARLSYSMAKSADSSIPNDMTEWLDTLESPNALYILSGSVMELYGNGFQTTSEAKKNLPPQTGQ